ncbi:ribbon-helix-helix domain-containing protein [Nostoc sp.]|uniref:ribbon-helix-helix domain-containing protein n=1 Tax=Nostoc sp. TaxID=1180 RepID=UPI002FF7DE0C
MNNYTISLSDSLNDFIKQAIAEGGYVDENEYITELLRNHRLKRLPKKLSDIEKLQLFNRKAERLEQYQLWKYIENNQSTYKVSGGTISNNLPDDELIEAPLITLRLFMQDKDHISIKNISNIYDSNPQIAKELKDAFVESRNNFNDFLKKESLFSIESIIGINEREHHHTTHYTNNEILEALLYAEIAHFTQMEDYQKLYSNPFNKSFNFIQIMVIIKNFKSFILIVKKINQQAIPYMKP